jgi:hypothetical protein
MLNPEPNRQVSVRLKNVIISDRDKFEGISISDMSKHFLDFLEEADVAKAGNVNTKIFLVIDDEVFAWLGDAPIPDSHMDSLNPAIKVIDGG